MFMKESPKHRQPAKKPDPPKAEEKKPKLIPLPIIENDRQALDEEMQELFDEDKVTHEHGRTEPERD